MASSYAFLLGTTPVPCTGTTWKQKHDSLIEYPNRTFRREHIGNGLVTFWFTGINKESDGSKPAKYFELSAWVNANIAKIEYLSSYKEGIEKFDSYVDTVKNHPEFVSVDSDYEAMANDIANSDQNI